MPFAIELFWILILHSELDDKMAATEALLSAIAELTELSVKY